MDIFFASVLIKLSSATRGGSRAVDAPPPTPTNGISITDTPVVSFIREEQCPCYVRKFGVNFALGHSWNSPLRSCRGPTGSGVSLC